jgi:probable rRNA maturation factor
VKITFGNPQREIEINRASIRRLVSSLARSENVRGWEVSLVFVDDAYIRDLKGRYMGIRRATDVLAFPLADSPSTCAGGDELLGEVYISAERAVAQARRNHVGLSQEVARLIVHGTLHLLGYRDGTRSSRNKMTRRQESFLKEHRALAADVATRRKTRRRPA